MSLSDGNEVWDGVAEQLRTQLTEAVWFSTFTDVRPIKFDEHGLTVSVPSNHVRDRILTRYLPLVEDALIAATGDRAQLLVLVDPTHGAPSHGTPSHGSSVSEPSSEVMRELEPLLAGAVTTPAGGATGGYPTGGRADDTPTGLDEAGLNPRYTFEAFVKGGSNQFALAAALRVAETPGRTYNPLFIFGSAGLGKTHLLHAIGHYVHSNYQHHDVRYVSTETFLNEFVDAIRYKTNTAFQRRYRDVDVLLIDDIQFLEGREGLQEEFFHTFNALHGANKQIVISSDRVPDAIPGLEERLIGRFKWGLVTDIQPPDLETRLAILRNKAERDGTKVPQDTLEFIASKISSNIRELEGALIRVTAFASLSGQEVTTDLAQRQLSSTSPSRGCARAPTRNCSPRWPATSASASRRSRARVVSVRWSPRQNRDVRVREITELSYPSIARLFGGRDHTTVIHAVDKIKADERAQGDLRPGHRAADAVEAVSRLTAFLRPRRLDATVRSHRVHRSGTCGQPCGQVGDGRSSLWADRRLSTELQRCQTLGIDCRNMPNNHRCHTLGGHLVVHNPQHLLRLPWSLTTTTRKGPTCEVPMRA